LQNFQCSIKLSFNAFLSSFSPFTSRHCNIIAMLMLQLLLEVYKISEPWHWNLHSVLSRSIVKTFFIFFSFSLSPLHIHSIHSYIQQKLENRDHSLLIAWWCNIKNYFVVH
jgi:hypothetical protein